MKNEASLTHGKITKELTIVFLVGKKEWRGFKSIQRNSG